MQVLHVPGTLWIAADVHLSAHAPRTCAAFLRFLEHAAAQADALFLCGDLFDAWVGDDAAIRDPPPWLAQVVQGLRHASSRIPVWFMHGNRDFLLGSSFTRLTGARALPDPVTLHTVVGKVLLSHGDQYCTDDRAYQWFRRIVRHAVVQRAYLALGLKTRRAIAAWARYRSQASQRGKDATIMDVNADAITRALRASGASILIHGHTHRPAEHLVEVDGRVCRRFVASDWDLDAAAPRMAWLQVDVNGVKAVTTLS